MAEAIDTAFVDIRPRFTTFAAETQAGIKAQLAAASVGSALTVPAGGIKGADRAARDLGRTLNSTTSAARGTAQGLSLVGGQAARLGTLSAAGGIGLAAGLALAGKAAVSAAIDFESGVAGIRKTVDATEPVIKQIADDLLDLSTDIPVASNELLGLAESAGQLGIETRGIVEFTKTVAELGVTTNLASDVAADALARLANITQLPQDQFDNLGSTIVELGNRTASTEAEIVEFGLRISGAGNQIGLTQDQILAFGAALASMGINAEAGGSSISTVMSRMASDVAKGGKRLEVFAETAGQSAEEFSASFRTNPAEAIIAFVEGLNRITERGGNVFATLDALGLGGIRIRDVLLRAAGSGDLLTKALDTGSQAWRRNNALQIEAARRFETTESNIQLVKNEANALAAELGKSLLPSVNRAAGVLRTGLSGARGLLDGGEDQGIKILNADLTELTGMLKSNEKDLERWGETVDVNARGAVGRMSREQAQLVEQIDRVGKSLNDSAGGTAKWVRIFSQASTTIAAAMADGVIDPAEKAAISVDELGRTFLRALPPDIFEPVAGAVKSGIEDAAAEAKRGAAQIMDNLKFGIEEGVPAAEAAARVAGKKIGTSLATGLATAATDAVKKSNVVGAVQDEAINEAIIAGSEGGQLAALKKKRDSLAAAIEKIEKIENPGKARVAQRRRLRADLAGVVTQIRAIESGIVADQESARNETEQKARDAERIRDERDRSLLDLVSDRISGAENRVAIAALDEGLKNDLKANANLQATLRKQMKVVEDRVKNVETKNDELRDLNRRLDAAKAERRRLLREQATQKLEDRNEALADAVTIARLRGNEKAEEKALRAQIASLNKQIALTKQGSKKRRQLIIEKETAKRDLRELLKPDDPTSADADRGTRISELLTENARSFSRFGSNIGQAGIDPLSGFDFNASLRAMLSRQGGAPDVAIRQTPVEGFQGAADRLVAALDRNTKAQGGRNQAAGVTTTGDKDGFNLTHYASVLGARANAAGRFWDSARARRMAEESTSG